MDWTERIHDPSKKKFENDVLSKLAGIAGQFEEKKPEITKPELKVIGFEDAIKELLDLHKNKR
jgi:hypothetical protein